MTIIHIETSTNVCSVAASHNGKCIFETANRDGLNHAAMLSPFVQQALDELNKLNLKPDAIAVSSGPGSYTGLRIGVSTAKGLCYGFDVPMIAISTLEIMVMEVLNSLKPEADTLLCPMIDARRMEVYTAFYNPALEIKNEVSAEIINEDSFVDILKKHPVYFFGNGSEKCKSVLTHPNANFITSVEPLAVNMIQLAEKKIKNKDFEDVAYFVPFYLKEFQATIPKNLLKE